MKHFEMRVGLSVRSQEQNKQFYLAKYLALIQSQKRRNLQNALTGTYQKNRERNKKKKYMNDNI